MGKLAMSSKSSSISNPSNSSSLLSLGFFHWPLHEPETYQRVTHICFLLFNENAGLLAVSDQTWTRHQCQTQDVLLLEGFFFNLRHNVIIWSRIYVCYTLECSKLIRGLGPNNFVILDSRFMFLLLLQILLWKAFKQIRYKKWLMSIILYLK